MMIVVGGPVATNYTSATDNLHCHATTLLGGTYLTATVIPSTLLGGTHLNATLFTGMAYFALAHCTVYTVHTLPLVAYLADEVHHWHAALFQSVLFDCVCFSKPNPPPGEDLRDSHQHFDRPPPPPPHHQTYSNICSLMGGEEDILYDLNIQSLFKLSSQIKL